MAHDVFISHVEEDADIALDLASFLEQARYRTWCYEVDSNPGVSYLVQTGQAIQSSGAVIVIVSANSLGSKQVTSEIVRAHESGKPFIPVLRDIAHAEFQARQPEWREAIGAATSIRVPAGGVADIFPRIADGLGGLGIRPRKRADPTKLRKVRRTLDELRVSEKARLPVRGAPEPAGTAQTKVERGPQRPTPLRRAYEAARRWCSRPVVWFATVFAVVVVAIFLLGGSCGTVPPATPTVAPSAPTTVPSTPTATLVTPQPSPALTPTPSDHTELEIIGHDGKSTILSNPSVSYPSGYGPSSETEGIRVLRGVEHVTLLWSEVRTLRFRSTQEEKDERTIWRHFVEATLSSGTVTEVELVEDWSMAYMGGGGTGLLRGQGELGETTIQFSEISVIWVLKYATLEGT